MCYNSGVVLREGANVPLPPVSRLMSVSAAVDKTLSLVEGGIAALLIHGARIEEGAVIEFILR